MVTCHLVWHSLCASVHPREATSSECWPVTRSHAVAKCGGPGGTQSRILEILHSFALRISTVRDPSSHEANFVLLHGALFESYHYRFKNQSLFQSAWYRLWWTWGDSNPLPPQCECGALSGELQAHVTFNIISAKRKAPANIHQGQSSYPSSPAPVKRLGYLKIKSGISPVGRFHPLALRSERIASLTKSFILPSGVLPSAIPITSAL